VIFFAIGCAVSVFAIVTKTRYLVRKLRSRFAGQPLAVGRNVSVVPVPVGAKLAAANAVANSKGVGDITSQLEQSAFERRRHTIGSLLALLEVRPPFA
jgi:hypothetical protein